MSDILWQSFANAVRIGEEADALLESFDAALEAQNWGRFQLDMEDEAYEPVKDEGEWCVTYFWFSYRLIELRPRPASRGLLCFALSLFREEDRAGNAWAGAARAKFYAGFAPANRPWTPDTLLVDGDGRSPNAMAISPRRWGNAGRGGVNPAWFFAGELEQLQSRADLAREIVSPLAALLNGEDEASAFAGCKATLPTGS